jgi:rhodanese-related sulfurtransferase
MSVSVISPKQLQDRIQAGEQVHLIDVRTPAEFREVHATVARNTPLESLNCGAVLAEHPTNAPLYVICRSGSRGKQACEKLYGGRLHQCRECRRRHDGLGSGWLSGCSRQEGHFSGTSGSHLCGLHVAGWRSVGDCSSSVLGWPLCICWSGSDVCRNHRHLRHGHDSGSHAVESGGQVTDCSAGEELLDNIEPIVLRLEF